MGLRYRFKNNSNVTPISEIFISFAVVAAIWLKSSGMMALVYRFTPSGLIEVSLSGPLLLMALYQSQQRKWPICWRGSTGGTRN